MDLPINDKELSIIVNSLTMREDTALYEKLKLIRDVRDANPDGPYKKILREQKNMII